MAKIFTPVKACNINHHPSPVNREYLFQRCMSLLHMLQRRLENFEGNGDSNHSWKLNGIACCWWRQRRDSDLAYHHPKHCPIRCNNKEYISEIKNLFSLEKFWEIQIRSSRSSPSISAPFTSFDKNIFYRGVDCNKKKML